MAEYPSFPVPHPRSAFRSGSDLPGQVARRVFRTDFSAPGWASLNLGRDLTPVDFRRLLVELGEALAGYYREHFGGTLAFLSMSRFDQQNPTRPHRDGGPDRSVLLLGYEPSSVPSRLFLLDHTRAACERGQTPVEFLNCCNPALGQGAELLKPHTVEVAGFASDLYRIVVINNSTLPLSEGHQGMLGLLHHAEIEPRPGASRVLDSVSRGIPGPGVPGLGEEERAAYVLHAEAVAS